MVAVGQLKQIGVNLWQDDAGNIYLDAEGTMPAEDQLPFSRPPAEAPMYSQMEDPQGWGRVYQNVLLTDPLYQSMGIYGKIAAAPLQEEAINRWGWANIMPATGDFSGFGEGLGVPSLAEKPTGNIRQFIESGLSMWTRDDWINGMRAMRNIGLIPYAIDPSQFKAMGVAELLNQINQHMASQSDNANLQTAYSRITDWDQVDAIAFGVMGISTLPPEMKKAYMRQYDMEKARIERDLPDVITTPQNWLAYLAFSGWNLNGLGLPVEGQEFRDATKPIPPAPTNIPSEEGAKALVVADVPTDPNQQVRIAPVQEGTNESTVANNTQVLNDFYEMYKQGKNFNVSFEEADPYQEIPWQQVETGTALGKPTVDISPTGVPMGTVSGTPDLSMGDEGFPLTTTEAADTFLPKDYNPTGAEATGIRTYPTQVNQVGVPTQVNQAGVPTQVNQAGVPSAGTIFQGDSTPLQRAEQGEVIQPPPVFPRVEDDFQEFNIPTTDYPAPTDIWDLRAQPDYYRKEPIGGWMVEDDARQQQLGLPPRWGDFIQEGLSSFARSLGPDYTRPSSIPMDLGDINYPNISPMDMPFINPVASGIQTVDYTQPISPTNIGYGGVGVGTGVEPSPWGGYNLAESYGYGWINPYTGKQFVPAQQY